MSLILPGNYPEPKRPSAKAEASIADLVIRKIKELVTNCIKDCNGGLLPSQKELKRLLRVEVHPDGRVFHFKGQPILFVGDHRFGKLESGEWQLQIPHRKLYLPNVINN